jgi:hypothetical protein
LELLNVTMDTPLEISTDGKNLIVSPMEDNKREIKFKAAIEVNKLHGKTLRAVFGSILKRLA